MASSGKVNKKSKVSIIYIYMFENNNNDMVNSGEVDKKSKALVSYNNNNIIIMVNSKFHFTIGVGHGHIEGLLP